MKVSGLVMWRCLVCAMCAVVFNACSSVDALSHNFRSTDHFRHHSLDSRVLFETGAEEFASLVANFLPSAERQVGAIQGAALAEDVRVYICATPASFKHMTGKEVKALTYRKAVFLSPRLTDHPESITSYLTHELSHLALLQRRGLYQYMVLPPWFTEGLAVLVSSGAGAQTVGEEEARRAIAAGNRFVPEMAGGPLDFLFQHYGSHWSLEPHMFYRQAHLFVSFLRKQDEAAFGRLISGLESGKSFRDSYRSAYPTALPAMWEVFVKDIDSEYAKQPAANQAL